MTSGTANVRIDESRRMRRRAVGAATLGNVLEWYDYTIYGFLVPVMAPVFFPDVSRVVAVLASFGVLGVGFVARPLGGLLFGLWGDRYGRRFSLALAMIVMGLSTLAAGLLPTFADIGVFATVLLLLVRLVQGLSMGGQWAGGGTFLVEYASPRRRGMYGGIHVAGVTFGVLLGSLVVLLVSRTVSEAEMAEFGWRIPFLAGALTVVAALILRFGVEETPAWHAAVRVAPSTVGMARDRRCGAGFRAISIAFGVTVLQAINAWVLLVWIVTFLTTVEYNYMTALLVNAIGLCAMILCLPLFGLLSDHFGRKRVMLIASVSMLLLVTPAFWGMRSGMFPVLVASYIMIMVCHALYAAPQVALLTELFPASFRVTGLSIGYNIAQTVFGGFAAFIASLLIAVTGNPSAATWYVMAGAAISAAALLTTRETAFSPLR